MKRTIFSLFFALFAVAVFSQAPDLGPKDPTVMVYDTIKRNWGGYVSGAVAFQTNCFQVATDQNPIPPDCLLDRLVGELTRQGKLKGANLEKPYRDYVEITTYIFLNRDIVLSTRDSRWNAPVKE
jgi:hypothetical protein